MKFYSVVNIFTTPHFVDCVLSACTGLLCEDEILFVCFAKSSEAELSSATLAFKVDFYYQTEANR
ncbi:hypothetical protein T11_7303 [Trichinella zimbabwensis]|uniref:Uncharacterized protein n=1 Tax=Trichinella zimbabwensis TaxID=268475 RepID=A0A0V1H502_9BILA|nr:hypothetical protein T11_7303 [Trichinella zimbabwensis]